MSDRDLNKVCVTPNADSECRRRGITLTDAARERAINHAVDTASRGTNWGQMAKNGVDHVVAGIIRDK